MSLSTIFGINGIGKDTIAEEIRKNNSPMRIISMSRVYMYILGISKTCDVKEKIIEEQYQQLEGIPQEKMREIENTKYKELLEKMANSGENIIFLGHLISALRLGNEIQYLTNRKIPKWFIDINKNLIQLVAPVNVISERRKNDQNRKRNSDVGEIIKHQKLCSIEWDRILNENDFNIKKMYIIKNIDLRKAVDEVEKIIYKK